MVPYRRLSPFLLPCNIFQILFPEWSIPTGCIKRQATLSDFIPKLQIVRNVFWWNNYDRMWTSCSTEHVQQLSWQFHLMLTIVPCELDLTWLTLLFFIYFPNFLCTDASCETIPRNSHVRADWGLQTGYTADSEMLYGIDREQSSEDCCFAWVRVAFIEQTVCHTVPTVSQCQV